MNKKVKELQLHGTVFGNPHGLLKHRNLSTSRDVSILAAFGLRD